MTPPRSDAAVASPAEAAAVVSRPAVEVADVLHAQGDHFVDQHPWLSVQQRTVLRALTRCRTAALGGHVDQCGACGHRAISYNSCRNRHCPKCQAQARARWLAARERELLDVPYVHVVFTLPHALLPLVLSQRHAAVHAALSGECGDAAGGRRRPAPPRRRDRGPEHPPHVGTDPRPASARALRRAGRRFVARSPAVDSAEVRGLLLAREGPQSCVSRQVRRGTPSRLRAWRTGSRRRDRDASAIRRSGTPSSMRSSRPTGSSMRSRPSAGPSAVLRYLGRYTHRVAISNHRLIAFDGERVTFRWKDYAHGDQWRTMTLTAMEFLRRFVQHVLPRGFVRIRQSGYLASVCRTARLALARHLLPRASPPPETSSTRAGLALSAMRSDDDHRPDPLGAPAGRCHTRLRHLMSAHRRRPTRRLRQRGGPRARCGVPRSRRARPSPQALGPYARSAECVPSPLARRHLLA